MTLLDYVWERTYNYLLQMPKQKRKGYGQFFTSRETAKFMADMLAIPNENETISILDPGCGSGILSAALIERIQSEKKIKIISLVCYENDSNILPLLKDNLHWIEKNATIAIKYNIITDNYILSQNQNYNNLFEADVSPQKFDLIIGNPPYMKISKNAPEALVMQDVCYGAPNTYFLFTAMSLFNLKQNGEMVYIIPRSWTSGVYFSKFRKKILSESVIKHIHLFNSRNQIFDEEDILQEIMIIKLKKADQKSQYITISSSQNNTDFSQKKVFQAPYQSIVQGNDFYVFLATSPSEIMLLEKFNHFQYTLPQIGLKMKTGLTVDFRNQNYLRSSPESHTVPLFYSQHIKNGEIQFPIMKKNEYILSYQKGLLQRNSNYLFVKRFTTKEESRRLQCGIYLSKFFPQYSMISTQNKINFICGVDMLSEEAVLGLYVLFNSTLYDQYYRILNGSTQVNSTEINSMPVPSLQTIEKMGTELSQMNDKTEKTCDTILRRFL